MAHQADGRLTGVFAEIVGDADTKAVFWRLLRQALQGLVETELTAAMGTAPHKRSDTRMNPPNGGRDRTVSMPAGFRDNPAMNVHHDTTPPGGVRRSRGVATR